MNISNPSVPCIPRVKVVAFFYNEELLAWLFRHHYWWADRIHAVVSRSTDSTREVLAVGRNVTIEDFEFPAGMDDQLKRDKVNQIITERQPYDWLIVVDADEFVWPASVIYRQFDLVSGRYSKSILAAVPPEETVLVARMRNVFRHVTDGDIDVHQAPVWQRRHGDPDFNSPGNAQYQKPIILRANRGITLGLGNHEQFGGVVSTARWFEGSHWQNADPVFAIARRCRDRRDRQSADNRRLGLGSQHHHITEEDVRRECRAHENDPLIF